MAKVDIKRLITSHANDLRALMKEKLVAIADEMIAQVIARMKTLPDSQRMNAIVGLDLPGQADYRAAVKTAMALIASDAIDSARQELPIKNVKLAEGVEDGLRLGEFDNLPASIKAKLLRQYQLVTDTQLTALEQAIQYQFNHSVDSTDSTTLIQSDLEDAVDEYVSGPRLIAGAVTSAAQIINETRNDYFSTPEAQDQIEGFEFVNPDPISPICQDLAGTVFAPDDPDRFRYTPPLHFNCKSWIRPLVTSAALSAAFQNNGQDDFEKLKPSTKKLEDSIQFSEAVTCGCFSIDALESK